MLAIAKVWVRRYFHVTPDVPVRFYCQNYCINLSAGVERNVIMCLHNIMPNGYFAVFVKNEIKKRKRVVFYKSRNQ